MIAKRVRAGALPRNSIRLRAMPSQEILSEIELTPDERAELEPVYEALRDWIARVERLAAECTT